MALKYHHLQRLGVSYYFLTFQRHVKRALVNRMHGDIPRQNLCSEYELKARVRLKNQVYSHEIKRKPTEI